MIRKPLLALLLAALCLPALAADEAKTLATIKKNLESRYEGLQIIDVSPAPVPGLYEVFTGDSIAYADATGDHLLVGKLIDTRSRTDLTSEKLDARNAIDFNTLPFERAIKLVKGNGARRIAIFEDPDCPYCKRLEHELQSVNHLTAYVFLFPLTDLHPKANEHALAIWCSPDRAKAWRAWMLDKTEPKAAACKGDPLAQNAALGEKLNISATPTIFLPNGRRIGGAISAEQMEKALASASAK